MRLHQIWPTLAPVNPHIEAIDGTIRYHQCYRQRYPAALTLQAAIDRAYSQSAQTPENWTEQIGHTFHSRMITWRQGLSSLELDERREMASKENDYEKQK